MRVIKNVVIEFVLRGLNDIGISDNDALQDCLLTLLNDILIEMLKKIRDIYCVLESLSILCD